MRHKIKGDLTSWNSSVWEFGQLMKSIKEDEEITLEVNSYGGDVFIGIDLCNTLRAHKGHVTAVVTGIAASAASIILMGANTIRAYSNTQLMLHNAWTIVAGNAKELRKAADDLDSIGESVLASYTGRLEADVAKRLLDEETFLSAQKALDLGLIDEIVDVEEAEEVYSDLFREQAQEFNDSLRGQVIAATAETAELETIFKTWLMDQIKNTAETPPKPEPKDPPKPPGDPQPGQKSAAIKSLFLNL